MGIATTDANQIIARPFENFIHNKDIDALVKRISEINSENEIELILLGMPRKENNELATIAEFIDHFYKKIKKQFNVNLVDERYSTRRAKEYLKENNKSEEYIKKNKDMYAAYILLSDYLISKNNNF